MYSSSASFTCLRDERAHDSVTQHSTDVVEIVKELQIVFMVFKRKRFLVFFKILKLDCFRMAKNIHGIINESRATPQRKDSSQMGPKNVSNINSYFEREHFDSPAKAKTRRLFSSYLAFFAIENKYYFSFISFVGGYSASREKKFRNNKKQFGLENFIWK